MKIIILGAGQVGTSVAESLVSEANDITVVDYDGERLANLQERLDLRVVTGNAASPSILDRAGAADADLLIAVTQSDQTNLCACRVAKTLFNVPTRIARLRAADYEDHPSSSTTPTSPSITRSAPSRSSPTTSASSSSSPKPCRCSSSPTAW
jgi:trk system potassium uptake protein TrkA